MYIHKVLTLLLLFRAAFCSAEVLIVNGTNSDITRYPFMASLRLWGTHGCGCSILTSTWVLTAAHCVSRYSADDMSVQYGVTKIARLGPNIVQVKRIVMHPNYDRKNDNVNDIAVLELSEKIVFNNKRIAPVILPIQNYEVPQGPNGARGILIGWGFDKSGGRYQTTLQEANVGIYSPSECKIGRGYKIKDTQLCAGDIGKGQCTGDSGGPVLYKSKFGLIVVGVVSWSGKPCATTNGVQTKVSKYVVWIHKTINFIS